MDLLIVESPFKIKTITKALGKGYKVLASAGHVVDLPKSTLGVDIENNFAPQYENIKSKSTLIKELKDAAHKADKVYLATDPDREGEAISWHLANLLGIDCSSACRVTFNDLTEGTIKTSMQKPRNIDLSLVDAQQARRVLDRLVGYEISPVLWRKVKTGLSAGRVQSPVLRLIVDREREIEAFVPQEYWTLDANLSDGSTGFTAQYYGFNGKKSEIASKEQADAIAHELENADFIVSSFKEGRKKRGAPTPFTTSTLQQEASRKLNFTTRKTMRIAQELYEGADLPEGSVGLITYMRTDSMRIAAEAVTEARNYINGTFGSDYLPEKPRFFKASRNAQDAHEAIRPTSMMRQPKHIRQYLSDDQYKLYKLIFERFAACQMADAVYATRNTEVTANGHSFHANSQKRIFDGYMAAYIEGQNKETEDKNQLPVLTEGQKLIFEGFDGAQHFTEPPARYNEASLVKEMEEKGIGRPSTYATIVSTILDREYVEREKKTLRPTPLGTCVVDFMLDAFPNIVDVGFTADMESELDKVEEGEVSWTNIVKDFYSPFHQTVLSAADAKHVRVPVIQTDIPCEKCGKMMVVRSSRFGKFLACPGYPECKFTRPLPENEVKEPCPKCGAKLVKRKSKTSKSFYGCSAYPECDFAASGVPTGAKCPECGGFMISGPRGRVYCNNIDCPTRAADKAKLEKKAKATAEKDKKSAAKKTAKKPATKKTTAKKTVKKTTEG